MRFGPLIRGSIGPRKTEIRTEKSDHKNGIENWIKFLVHISDQN